MERIEKYLYKEVSKVVNVLFRELKRNNINVELERNELDREKLNAYEHIYNKYKESLLKIQKKALLKYKDIDNFDYIFAKIIQNIVSKKQGTMLT